MNKKLIFILAILVIAIGAFILIQNNGSFSLTRQISENIIEYDTELPCSTVQDCIKIPDFPSDGYCAETTCRVKIDISKMQATAGGLK
jgi:hypothetical protein